MVYLFGILWIMLGVVIFGSYLIINFLPVVPQLFKDLFFYGKIKGKVWTTAKKIEIPKRSFMYFYLFGALVNGTMSILIVYSYSYHIQFPPLLNGFLHWIRSNKTPSQPNPLMPVILSTLMWFQNTRRYLECRYISSYSSSSINLIHFFLAIFFYSSFPILILSDSILPQHYKGDLFTHLSVHQIVGCTLFFVCSYYHHCIHCTLARLRTDKKGNVKTLNHLLPSGHWLFEYVSSPHFLLEILIYLSFSLIDAFYSFNLTSLLFFVVSNQLTAALMTHQWYKKTFDLYPPFRKAIIPFLL